MPCIMPTSLVRTLWATQLVEPGLATNVIRAVLACGVSAIFVVSSSSLKNGCAMPKVPYFRGMPRGRECAATVGLDWSWDCGACTMGVHGACGRGPNCEYSLHPPYRTARCADCLQCRPPGPATIIIALVGTLQCSEWVFICAQHVPTVFVRL